MAASKSMKNTLDEKISQVLRGYVPAVECFLLLRDILHFWDDLIDRDHALADAHIHESMFKVLISLPSNEFYRKYQDLLQPVLINAIANWRAANQFEGHGDNRALQLAFVIRSDYANILIQMAYIVGGHDWLMEVTPTIRAMWTEEDFEAYLTNLEREKCARLSGEKHVL
jgi:hypothetical protein